MAEAIRTEPQKDICIHCKMLILKGIVWKDEWAHWHGDRYCHDRYSNFTITPLQVATPAYHGTEDVL